MIPFIHTETMFKAKKLKVSESNLIFYKITSAVFTWIVTFNLILTVQNYYFTRKHILHRTFNRLSKAIQFICILCNTFNVLPEMVQSFVVAKVYKRTERKKHVNRADAYMQQQRFSRRCVKYSKGTCRWEQYSACKAIEE